MVIPTTSLGEGESLAGSFGLSEVINDAIRSRENSPIFYDLPQTKKTVQATARQVNTLTRMLSTPHIKLPS